MENSPWRQPYLADLTYGELHRLVNEFVIGQRLKVLDIGCGTGFLSLELAREGHTVTGLDQDQRMIDLAIQTMKTDLFSSERGRLEYYQADFTSWDGPDGDYDLVVISRMLHHVRNPEGLLAKAQRLLRHGGRLVCVEFAYDQFDLQTATWLYHTQKALELSGWYKLESGHADDPARAASQILREWLEEYQGKEKFNKFEEMRKPLYNLFREDHFSWKPYLYWEIIARMRLPSNEAELEMARSISAMEQSLIEKQQIKPVLFCFVGTRT